jgi:dihydroxyacid dehydratase/phosphogluconate dehydratase
VVFDGSDDYHHRINDPALNIDERTMLVIRGAGPWAGPVRPKWSTCNRPIALIKRGIMNAADPGRRPPVRHLGQPVDPERLAGKRGGRRPGLLRTGDVVRVDLNTGTLRRAGQRRGTGSARKARAYRRYRRARRRGSRSTAPPSASCKPAPAWSWPLPYRGVGTDMPRHNH